MRSKLPGEGFELIHAYLKAGGKLHYWDKGIHLIWDGFSYQVEIPTGDPDWLKEIEYGIRALGDGKEAFEMSRHCLKCDKHTEHWHELSGGDSSARCCECEEVTLHI